MSAVREEQPKRDVHLMLVGQDQAAKPERAPQKRESNPYEELKKDFLIDYSLRGNLGPVRPAGEEILDARQLPEDLNHTESDPDVKYVPSIPTPSKM